MNKLSKKLYVRLLASTLMLFLLSLILLAVLVGFPPGSKFLHQVIGSTSVWQSVNIALLVFSVTSGILFLITQFVITLVLLYKMWAAIQDGHARTTPGKAIGFLFIPFFNLIGFSKSGEVFRPITTRMLNGINYLFLIYLQESTNPIRG